MILHAREALEKYFDIIDYIFMSFFISCAVILHSGSLLSSSV